MKIYDSVKVFEIVIGLTNYSDTHRRVMLYGDGHMRFTYLIETNKMSESKAHNIENAKARWQNYHDGEKAKAKMLATPHRPTAAAA